MKKQQGFTLIELMIVVAIIAILAALALPAYQDYTVRTRVSEGLSVAAAAKLAVAESANENGGIANVTAANTEYDFTDNSTKYVESVAVGDAGVITITARATNAAGGEPILTLTPAQNSDGTAIDWTCAYTVATKAAQIPSQCR